MSDMRNGGAEARKGVALLIGAGDAIGAAVATRFAEGGHAVRIVRRDAAKAADLCALLTSKGHDVAAISVDAREEAQVKQLFASVEADVGPIEMCLFNAGANTSKPLLETEEKLFYRVWQLACYAGFLVGREAARYMVPRAKGTILFTGATASVRGGSGFAAFASAKFALRGFAQSLARELGPKNVHVAHLLIDGGIDSPEIHRRLGAQGVDVAALSQDALIDTRSVAETYWFLHAQKRDGWTHELDLRPAIEKW